MKAVKFNYVRSYRTAEYIRSYEVFTCKTHAKQIKAIKKAIKAAYETLNMLNQIDNNWFRCFPCDATNKFREAHPFCHMAFEDTRDIMKKERDSVEHTIDQLEYIERQILNA